MIPVSAVEFSIRMNFVQKQKRNWRKGNLECLLGKIENVVNLCMDTMLLFGPELTS